MSESVRVGIRSPALFETMDSTEEVAEWLRAIGMSEYIPVFRAQSVTGCTLLSLNSVELRKTLGVTNLKDRRIIMEGVCYLRQSVADSAKKTIPEDGTILTQQSNERTFLAYLRFSILMHTVAMATVRLLNVDNRENAAEVLTAASLLCVLAVGVLLYGTYRYFWMYRLVEEPGKDTLPNRVNILTPVFTVCIAIVLMVFSLKSESTEDAAMIAVLGI